VKKDDDQFRNIGTKPQLLTLKKENMKLLKRIAKLEAENVTLQKRIKVLKKEPKTNRQNCSFFKEMKNEWMR
jgi:predicted nuclease with TOPRIM domain